MEDRTISLKAAIETAENVAYAVDEHGSAEGWLAMLVNSLEALPSTQPEQKIGKFVRWMEKRETPDCISYTPHCKCSLCGNELFIESINYCYMCGAELVEDRVAERREEGNE